MHLPGSLVAFCLGPCVLAVLGATRPRPTPKGQPRLRGELLEFRECDASSYVRVVNWTQRHTAGGDMAVDMLFAITKPGGNNLRISFTKCSEYETDCERVLSVPASCAVWNADGMMWTPIQRSIVSVEPPHRPLGCPANKEGLYETRNTSFDLDSAARLCPFPLENSVWTIKTQTVGALPKMCLIARARLIRWASRPSKP